MAKQPEKTEAERWREIADQYRNEATRLGTAVIELEAEVQQLLAELAEAKAASVPPVKFSWCYESNECDIIINGMNDEDSTLLGNWLDDRMKERGEG